MTVLYYSWLKTLQDGKKIFYGFIKLAIHVPVCRRGRTAQFNLHSFYRFPMTTYTPRFARYAGLRSHTLSGQNSPQLRVVECSKYLYFFTVFSIRFFNIFFTLFFLIHIQYVSPRRRRHSFGRLSSNS